METEGGKRERDRWWMGWNSRGLKALAISCALAFVLLTAYGYLAFPSNGVFNAELGFGGAVALFFIGFFLVLMNEHARRKQRAGEQVRF